MKNRVLFVSSQALSLPNGISYFNSRVYKSLKIVAGVDNCSFINVNDVCFSRFLGKYIQRLFFLLVFILKIRVSQTIIFSHVNLIFVARLFSRLLKRKKIIFFGHGIEVWKKLHDSDSIDCADLDCEFYFVSSYSMKRCSIYNNWKHIKKSVIYNILSDETVSRIRAKTSGISKFNESNGIRILFVGRLDSRERYKGLDELFDVIGSSSDLASNIQINVVGCGDDYQRLLDKSQSLAIDERVKFWGFLPDDEKFELMNDSDYLYLCGSGEGFGIVLLEGYVAGLGLISSSRDGSSEVVKMLGRGFVCDPFDGAAMKKFLFDLVAKGRPSKKQIELLPRVFTEEGLNSRISDMLHIHSGEFREMD